MCHDQSPELVGVVHVNSVTELVYHRIAHKVTVLPNGSAPAGTTINTSIAIDARGADAGVEARLRILAGQIARQSSSMTLDAIRRGGSAYETVRG
jgi:hypothetical protein